MVGNLEHMHSHNKTLQNSRSSFLQPRENDVVHTKRSHGYFDNFVWPEVMALLDWKVVHWPLNEPTWDID